VGWIDGRGGAREWGGTDIGGGEEMGGKMVWLGFWRSWVRDLVP